MGLLPELFDRVVEVIVGPRAGVGKKITGLRVSFQVERTLESNPNPAKIALVNLSSETRSLLEIPKSVVTLRAGYGENPKEVFQGDIARVETQRNGADLITTIEAGDGEVAFQNKSLDVSFMPGINSGTVLASILGAFGLKPGQVVGFNPAAVFQNGLALAGMIRDHLDVLTGKQGLEWSIQDGAVQILPSGKGTIETAVVLSRSTGLVGSPFKTTVLRPDLIKSSGVGAGLNSGAASGVKLRSLMNPEIKPGRYILVKSDFVNGVFRCEKVMHSGDNRAANWYSEIEAR